MQIQKNWKYHLLNALTVGFYQLFFRRKNALQELEGTIQRLEAMLEPLNSPLAYAARVQLLGTPEGKQLELIEKQYPRMLAIRDRLKDKKPFGDLVTLEAIANPPAYTKA